MLVITNKINMVNMNSLDYYNMIVHITKGIFYNVFVDIVTDIAEILLNKVEIYSTDNRKCNILKFALLLADQFKDLFVKLDGLVCDKY
jgi:hypothetical protein